MILQRVKEALEELKNGKMIIMIDDEHRENEGDLVYAATFSTPDHVNFMATHARGLICVALSRKCATRLSLNPMVSNNDSQYETAFTVSVDDKRAKTGISSTERDMTIKTLANPLSVPDDLARPGHIFPLIAKDGGVLERTGHTEGSVDICNLAGISPVAVICEIIKEDGEMARRDDLTLFAEKHNLKSVYISDLIEYRLNQDSLITQTKKETVEFLGHNIRLHEFEDHTKCKHLAYVFGEITDESYVKFHNMASDLELLQNTTKYRGLVGSVDYLAKNNGVLIFLEQTNNDGYEAMKNIGIGAQILKNLGIHKIRLLVNTDSAKDFNNIKGFGLDVIEQLKVQ